MAIYMSPIGKVSHSLGHKNLAIVENIIKYTNHYKPIRSRQYSELWDLFGPKNCAKYGHGFPVGNAGCSGVRQPD